MQYVYTKHSFAFYDPSSLDTDHNYHLKRPKVLSYLEVPFEAILGVNW